MVTKHGRRVTCSPCHLRAGFAASSARFCEKTGKTSGVAGACQTEAGWEGASGIPKESFLLRCRNSIVHSNSYPVHSTVSLMDRMSTDNLDLMLGVLPPSVRDALSKAGELEDLIEVVVDLGRRPEARYTSRSVYLNESLVSRQEIEYVESRIGHFTRDNRAGIERTLHRISAMRNRLGEIVGLTCRVGR